MFEALIANAVFFCDADALLHWNSAAEEGAWVKNLINRLRTSKRIGSKTSKNIRKPSNAPEPARQHSYQLLQVQPCWDFNNNIIEFRVPVSLALSLCQYVLRPRRGLGQASPSLEAPRLQALERGPLSST